MEVLAPPGALPTTDPLSTMPTRAPNSTTIFTRITRENFMDWANDYAEKIDSDAELSLKIYGGSARDTLEVKDLQHAMKRGQSCTKYTIRQQGATQPSDIGVSKLIVHFGSLRALFRVLESLEFPTEHDTVNPSRVEELGGVRYKVWKGSEKAIRVFSPIHLHHLKPLTKEPKRWNVRLATRAILNGQYDWLRCEGRYSDDYARDAALNYSKGEIADNLSWVANVIERPGGWRVSVKDEDEGILWLCCHHFDTNAFKFNVDAAKERSLEEA
jgi:hypothetical protein